ncbi:unnamed protein product [Paramecium primaurelia]|uniref:Uncharacterized protein n=1 Tax=Paramecium primaurelia TaxID=5886 RepID=A0A8S1NCN8_PARPR|nr:unnamed protein product [Paramecium primaurelia]
MLKKKNNKPTINGQSETLNNCRDKDIQYYIYYALIVERIKDNPLQCLLNSKPKYKRLGTLELIGYRNLEIYQSQSESKEGKILLKKASCEVSNWIEVVMNFLLHSTSYFKGQFTKVVNETFCIITKIKNQN